MINKELSPELANRVYDILVKVCGASEMMREAFVLTETTEHCHEWRFGGKIGFGGKFWNTNGRLYVNCYNEDETRERKRIVGEANKLLAALYD